MRRVHTFIVVLAFGVAAVGGTYAMLQSTSLSQQSSSTVTDKQIRAREIALNRAEAKLRKVAKQRPPRLPALPTRAHRAVVTQSVTLAGDTSSQSSSSHSSSEDHSGDDHGGDDHGGSDGGDD
jgi:hypothetical protein